MENKTLLAGGAGVVVLSLLFGWMFSGGDDDLENSLSELTSANKAMEERLAALDANSSAVTEQLAAISETQTTLTAQLQEVQEQAAATGSVSEDLQARIATLTSDIAATQDAIDTQSAAAASDTTETAEAEAAAAAEETETATEETAEAEVEPEAEAPAAAPAAAGTLIAGAGQTVTLGDTMRVFLSRADVDAERATVAVNGVRTVDLRKGQPAGVMAADGFCHLTMTDISANGVSLSQACGDDVPAATGTRVGDTQVFDQGARVFVSRLMPEDEAVMVTVNSLSRQEITYDEPMRLRLDGGTCHLSLDNIDRGHADLSLTCPE